MFDFVVLDGGGLDGDLWALGPARARADNLEKIAPVRHAKFAKRN